MFPRVSRSLLLLVALLMVAGCSYRIQGDPVPAPLPPGPAVPTPRKTAGIDPCGLLTENDLKPLGTLKGKPTPKNDPKVPNSCLFQLNENAYLATAVPYRSFDESKERQKDGKEVFTTKHATWLSCGEEQGDMVCTATIAVSRTESLLVGLGIKGGTEAKVRSSLEVLSLQALRRLPAAS